MKVRPASGPESSADQGLLQGMGDECPDRVFAGNGDHAALTRVLYREAHITRSRVTRAGRRPQSKRERMTAGRSGGHLPRAVWALGLTSLFMDTSSELIHGLLPVFLMVTLGASATALGLIEGIAEATAQITRVFSGWLSDALGKRKALDRCGLRSRRRDQAALPARQLDRSRPPRALPRSHRQGHQRRASRCAGRRPDSA